MERSDTVNKWAYLALILIFGVRFGPRGPTLRDVNSAAETHRDHGEATRTVTRRPYKLQPIHNVHELYYCVLFNWSVSPVTSLWVLITGMHRGTAERNSAGAKVLGCAAPK